MAVVANLVFSSLAMPVFSADLSSLETELSTEIQGETEAQSTEEQGENAVSVKGTKLWTETENREETESQAETKTPDEEETESQAETKTPDEAETESQAETKRPDETETETQAVTETEIQTETVSAQETEAQTDAFSAQENVPAVQAADPAQEKTPEEILKNTSVTLMKNGEVRTENFRQQETSVDVRVKLDSSMDRCWMSICGYAGNTGFDPDSIFNRVLWSGWVTNGFEETLTFAEEQLPLPVGYDVIACLNVPVGDVPGGCG